MYKYSEKAAAGIIRKLLKAAAKTGRGNLAYTWIDSAGMQCMTDGFRAFRLLSVMPGLPDLPNGEKPFDLKRVYDSVEINRYEFLPVPGDDEIEALIAEDKPFKTRYGYEDNASKRRGFYFFGDGKPVVNLEYLRDMLKVFPDAAILYNPENPLSPLYVNSSAGDGLLLPVRLIGHEDFSPRAWKPLKKAGRIAPVYSLNQFAARFAS